jgi:hypothetical protein
MFLDELLYFGLDKLTDVDFPGGLPIFTIARSLRVCAVMRSFTYPP